MLYSQSDTHPRRRFGLRRMTYPDKGSKKPRNFLYFILIFFNYICAGKTESPHGIQNRNRRPLCGHRLWKLGDLLVTCYSTYSRNRRLGLLIGHGCTVKSALNEMTMVAEGYFAADCIRHINFRHRVDMPIADMVYRVLYEGASARRCMQELTTKLI